VELDCVKPRFLSYERNGLGVMRVEDADALDTFRKPARDRGDLRGGHLPLTGGEDEADRVRAQVSGELSVFEICVAAKS